MLNQSNYQQVFQQYSWEDIKATIYQATANDVSRSLGKTKLDVTDFMNLISPAAEPYLEEMAFDPCS